MDQDCRNQIISEDYTDFLIENENINELLKISPNICNTVINNVHSVAYIPIANLPENMLQTYGYSIYPSCFGLLDIGSMEASGVNRVRNIPNFNLKGRGVLIGIVDTGIDYTHPAFKNADGTTRIISIWDQTIQNNNAPAGFDFGTEYTLEQINLALTTADPFAVIPSIDEVGHGTLLAGLAAGNSDEENNFTGVATEASIVVVKLKQAKRFLRDFFSIPQDAVCFQETDIMLGVKYLLSVANKLLRPISICIGIGTSQGSHDGRGALSSYLSSVADQRGVGVTVAGGNEGNRGHHYMGTVDSGTGYNTVELRVGPNNQGFSMELWGNSPNLFSIDILSPTGEYIPRIPARIEETRVINFIFEETVIYVDYQIIEAQTGDELILIRFRNPTEGIWRFRVYSSVNLEPRFHIWLPIHTFIDEETYFTEASPDFTITSPGNTEIPITVTAYDYTNQSLYINASRGNTRTNFPKPSLAAPGVNLIGPAPNNSYITATGTSIAAAHTAGVVAMVLEWGISLGNQTQLDTLGIKNFLNRGAKREANLVYPNPEWGYGILDVFNSYNSLRGRQI